MNDTLDRLGQTVKARRLALPGSPTQAEMCATAGVSLMTWGNVERGTPVNERNRVKIALALGWTPDSIDRILDGEAPTEAEPADDLDARLSRLEEAVESLVARFAAVEARLDQRD